MLTHGGLNVPEKALQVIKDNVRSLWPGSSKGSHYQSKANQFVKFGDEMPLEAQPGYGSATNLPMNVEQAMLVDIKPPQFLCSAQVLVTQDTVKPFLEAAFYLMKESLHFLPKANVLLF